jgi:hypothetical protein
MLRPFNANPLEAERWPRRVLQEPPAKPRSGVMVAEPARPQGSTKVDHATGAGRPGEPRKPRTALNQPPPLPDLVVVDIEQGTPTWDRIRRLSVRFFGTDGAGNAVEVTRIRALESPTAARELEAAGAGLTDGSKHHPIVSKFVPLAAPDAVLASGRVAWSAAVELPMGLGLGFVLPNVFSITARTSDRGSDHEHTHGRAMGTDGSTRVVLCDAALGALCVRPSEHLAASRDASLALKAAGFDSVALRLGTEDFVALFDPALLRPTHVVDVTFPPNSPLKQFGSTSPPPNDQATRSPVGGGSQDAPLAPSPSSLLRTSFSKALAAAEDAVSSDSARLQALIRRQCGDLEEALRARREWLLAAVRKEEAQAALRIQERRSSPGLVTAGDVAMADSYNSLRGMTLDTGRLLAAVDNLALKSTQATSHSSAFSAARHASASQQPANDAIPYSKAPAQATPGPALKIPTPPSSPVASTLCPRNEAEPRSAAGTGLNVPRQRVAAAATAPLNSHAGTGHATAKTTIRPSTGMAAPPRAGRGGGTGATTATAGSTPASDPRYYTLTVARPATRDGHSRTRLPHQ